MNSRVPNRHPTGLQMDPTRSIPTSSRRCQPPLLFISLPISIPAPPLSQASRWTHSISSSSRRCRRPTRRCCETLQRGGGARHVPSSTLRPASASATTRECAYQAGWGGAGAAQLCHSTHPLCCAATPRRCTASRQVTCILSSTLLPTDPPTPPPPETCSYAAPLHRIKTDDMLPLRLLTPFQAENDHHIKDTYNYVTVQVSGPEESRRMRAGQQCAVCALGVGGGRLPSSTHATTSQWVGGVYVCMWVGGWVGCGGAGGSREGSGCCAGLSSPCAHQPATCPPAHLPACLPACMPTCLPACMHACLPAHLPPDRH